MHVHVKACSWFYLNLLPTPQKNIDCIQQVLDSLCFLCAEVLVLYRKIIAESQSDWDAAHAVWSVLHTCFSLNMTENVKRVKIAEREMQIFILLWKIFYGFRCSYMESILTVKSKSRTGTVRRTKKKRIDALFQNQLPSPFSTNHCSQSKQHITYSKRFCCQHDIDKLNQYIFSLMHQIHLKKRPNSG